MEFVRTTLQRLRESLTFVPALVVAAGIVLARASILVDRDPATIADLPLVLSVSAAGGRTIATTVAGATVTVAAIVFSITALTSQITSTQYSPRAVAGFFEDRFQQLVIGLVVGTFVFSLLVLAGLGDVASGDTVTRSLAVTLTVVLGIASIVAIVAYLDHSLRRMRIGPVVRRIAETTVEAVERTRRHIADSDTLEDRPQPHGEPHRVAARRMGWVRGVDAAKLARGLPAGMVASIEVRVGEAVFAHDLVASVWSSEGDEVRGSERIDGLVRRAIHIGRDRTLAGDPGYGIRQLVDIGLRALSSGVNDPTTASDVIQHLKAPLRAILSSDPPSRVFAGSRRQRVVLAEAPSRSDHVHAAFGEIRLAARGQPVVLRSLLEVLGELIAGLKSEGLDARTSALREEAELTIDAAQRSGFSATDLERVMTAAKHIERSENTGNTGSRSV